MNESELIILARLLKEISETLRLIQLELQEMKKIVAANTPDPAKWMTETEASEKLQRTPRTLSRWRNLGKINCVKVGREPLYERPEIEQLAAKIHRGIGDQGQKNR